MSESKLNTEQQIGYDKIMQFINDKEKERMFCLKGYAGTGKTFLISKIVNDIMAKNEKLAFWDQKAIAMTAPTNKAVQVLRESSGLQNVTFKTIHSLLGLKEVIRDSGEIDFEKAFEDYDNIREFNIVIIDEVSMLDDKLFFEIKRYVNDVKLILMGDPAQIPPVNKTDCEPFLNPVKHGIIEYQLKQIMRQAEGSAIVTNSFQLRDNLTDDQITFEPGEDLKMLSSSTERAIIAEKFAATFTGVEVADHTKVIAWTNRKVEAYNQYIRKLLFGPDIPKLMIGERLVMNSPHPSKAEQYVEETTTKDGKTKKRKKKVESETLTTNQEVTVVSYEVLPCTLKEGVFECYVTNITFIGQSGKKEEGCIRIVHERSQSDFDRALAKIKAEAIRASPADRGKVWKRFYEFMRSVADVQYSYAITAHKSQGSTYRSTFLDVGNITQNPRVVERNRIMYTALTRAKQEVVLIL